MDIFVTFEFSKYCLSLAATYSINVRYFTFNCTVFSPQCTVQCAKLPKLVLNRIRIRLN